MRHHNPTSTSYFSHHCGCKVYEPHQTQYVDSYWKNGFEKAYPEKTYVKALRYIADHDGCKRKDITCALAELPSSTSNISIRGQYSNMYAQLLYIDVIDYDKDFCYHITEKGKKVLRKAYINEMLRLIKCGKLVTVRED